MVKEALTGCGLHGYHRSRKCGAWELKPPTYIHNFTFQTYGVQKKSAEGKVTLLDIEAGVCLFSIGIGNLAHSGCLAISSEKNEASAIGQGRHYVSQQLELPFLHIF